MPEPIKVTVYNDPGCPWAYSAVPALRVIDWRYGDQLDWHLVLIGLAERGEQYVERGYTPVWMAQAYVKFGRYGMPFSTTPRSRVLGTGRACRAIAAARFLEPGTEWLAFPGPSARLVYDPASPRRGRGHPRCAQHDLRN